MVLLNDEEADAVARIIGEAACNVESMPYAVGILEKIKNKPPVFGVVISYDTTSRVSEYGLYDLRDEAVSNMIDYIGKEFSEYDVEAIKDSGAYYNEARGVSVNIVEF